MSPSDPACKQQPPGKPAVEAAAVVVLALLPFALKAAALAWFSSNYLAQSAYKLLQLAVPVAWRRRVDRATGWRSVWPVDEPLPALSTWLIAVVLALATIALAAVLIPWLAGRSGIDPRELRQHFDDRYALNPWRRGRSVPIWRRSTPGWKNCTFGPGSIVNCQPAGANWRASPLARRPLPACTRSFSQALAVPRA